MSDIISDEELAKIRGRESKATPGPWVIPPEYKCLFIRSDTARLVGTTGVHDDAVFMVSSRSDIPRLLESVEKLKAKVAELQRWYDVIDEACGGWLMVPIVDDPEETLRRLAVLERSAGRHDAPAWHDRPTCPGLWMCYSGEVDVPFFGGKTPQASFLDLDAGDIARGAPFGTSRVYGPIPKDGE